MMEQPNFTSQMLRIHSIVTRGLAISSNNCKYFIENNNFDPLYLEGFLNYNRALMSFVHAHHLSEDELVFPFFKDTCNLSSATETERELSKFILISPLGPFTETKFSLMFISTPLGIWINFLPILLIIFYK